MALERRKPWKSFVLVLAAVLVLFPAAAGQAKTILVNQTDPAPEAYPWCCQSITEALSLAEAGDTIVLAPGVYDSTAEQFPLVVSIPLTITSQGGPDKTRIVCPSLATVFQVEAPGVEISGLTIEHAGKGLVVTGSGFRLLGNRIELSTKDTRLGSTGLWLAGGWGAELRQNEFVGCGVGLAGRPLSGESAGKAVYTGLFEVGSDVELFKSHIIMDNLVNGKPLLFAVGLEDGTISGAYGQIILVDCRDLQLFALEIAAASIGLHVLHSNGITVTDSHFSGNSVFGACFAYCQDCCIERVSFQDCNHGLDFRSSHQSRVWQGEVIACGQGVFLVLSNHNQFEALTVAENGVGFFASGSENNLFGANLLEDNDVGFYFQNAPQNLLVENTILRSGQSGVRLHGENRGTILQRNRFSVNRSAVLLLGVLEGKILANYIEESVLTGVFLEDVEDCTIEGNLLVSNSVGIKLGEKCEGVRIAANSFSGNEQDFVNVELETLGSNWFGP